MRRTWYILRTRLLDYSRFDLTIIDKQCVVFQCFEKYVHCLGLFLLNQRTTNHKWIGFIMIMINKMVWDPILRSEVRFSMFRDHFLRPKDHFWRPRGHFWRQSGYFSTSEGSLSELRGAFWDRLGQGPQTNHKFPESPRQNDNFWRIVRSFWGHLGTQRRPKRGPKSIPAINWILIWKFNDFLWLLVGMVSQQQPKTICFFTCSCKSCFSLKLDLETKKGRFLVPKVVKNRSQRVIKWVQKS